MEKDLPESVINGLKKVNPSLIEVVKDFFGISNSLEKKFPQLTKEQANELTSSLFSEIAKNIEDGNHIAFIQPKEDPKMTVYGFQAFSSELISNSEPQKNK